MAPAWTNTTDAQTRIGGTFASADTAALEDMLEASEQAIITYLGYNPSTGGSLTRYYTGDGTPYLYIDNAITSITNVWLDTGGYFGVPSDSFHATETLLTSGTDYVLENENARITGRLIRIGYVWPYNYERQPTRLSLELGPCLGCIKVTYVKSTGPNAAIIEATYELGAALWSARVNGMGAINSASMDGASYNVSPVSISGDAAALLFSPAAELLLRQHKRYFIPRM